MRDCPTIHLDKNESKGTTVMSFILIYIHILFSFKLFLYFNMCLSVLLDSLSWSFTSISFLTTNYKLFLYFNLCLSVMLNSLSCLFTSISFLTKTLQLDRNYLVKEQLVVRKDMDVKEHERLSNITLRHKWK
jgi:hypothetical protein